MSAGPGERQGAARGGGGGGAQGRARARNARTAAAWVGGAARPALRLSGRGGGPASRLAHLTRSVRSPAACAAVGAATAARRTAPPTTAGRRVARREAEARPRRPELQPPQGPAAPVPPRTRSGPAHSLSGSSSRPLAQGMMGAEVRSKPALPTASALTRGSRFPAFPPAPPCTSLPPTRPRLSLTTQRSRLLPLPRRRGSLRAGRQAQAVLVFICPVDCVCPRTSETLGHPSCNTT